jgi:hypothetical protein
VAPRTFRAKIEPTRGGGAYVTVPYDVEKAHGKKRVKVKVTIDGVPYRGSIVRMFGTSHQLPVLKAIRERIGKGPGERVAVSVWEDLEPRVVAVPRDLGSRLAREPKANAFFRSLSYTCRKEYARWITGAKRSETREARVARAIQLLNSGVREPGGSGPVLSRAAT